MRRPLWYRALIGAWGFWFAAVLIGPESLHACPVHGGHAAHMAMGGHHAGSMPNVAHGSSQDARHESAECTCLGACCCSPSAITPTTASRIPVGTVTGAVTAVYPEVVPPRISRASLLPFANGPPAQGA